MSAALLDVNVLVALFDSAHLHHEAAHRWLASHGRRPWATCPLTINGCIRALSHPSYPTVRATAADVVARLRILCTRPLHEFWPDDVSLLDETKCRASRLAGATQVADVYLLSLAVSRHGRLVTFDRTIPLEAVPGAAASHIEVLAIR